MGPEIMFVSISKSIHSAGFYDEACFEYYLKRLLNCARSYEVKLHAYLLLKEQVLLLCTPLAKSQLDIFCKFLNASYSEYFNQRFDRSILVWNKKPSVHQVNQGHAMVFQRYIENLPVVKGLGVHPGTYRWSSYCSNSFSIRPAALTPHRKQRELYLRHRNPYRVYRDTISRPLTATDLKAFECKTIKL